MDYTLAMFRADLALMDVPDGVPPTPHVLRLKRTRLAKTPGVDQLVLSQAFDRLMDFAVRFAEMKLFDPPEEPEAEAPSPAPEDPQLAQWQAALASQTQRHNRRRGAYEKVRPVPPPSV